VTPNRKISKFGPEMTHPDMYSHICAKFCEISEAEVAKAMHGILDQKNVRTN